MVLNEKIINKFIERFWYVPSDVLQRSIESSIWNEIKIHQSILEIGCADGEISKLVFNNLEYIDTGIDIIDFSDKTLINSFYKNVIHADSADMPFKKSTFNTIVANSTFEHIQDLEKTFLDCHRVLKNKGKLIFCVPLKDFDNAVKNKYGNDISKRINIRLDHRNYFTEKEWLEMLNNAKFKNTKVKKYFSNSTLSLWVIFHLITTQKIGNTEIWSLLQKFNFFIEAPFKFFLQDLVKKTLNKKDNSYLMAFFIAEK